MFFEEAKLTHKN